MNLINYKINYNYKEIHRIGIISVFSFFLLINKLWAEPFDFYCAGSHSRIMGCAGVGGTSGYEATYLNPSLIPAKKNLGVGYLFSSQKVDVKLDGQKIDKLGNPLQNVSQLNVGLAIPLSSLPLFEENEVSRNISVGLAGLLPTGKQLIRIGTIDTKTPSTLLYGNRNTRFSIYSGLGGRVPIDRFKFYLGAGVLTLANLPIIIEANLSPDKDLVIIDGALEPTIGFIGGLAFEFSDENFYGRVGGVYRSSTKIEIPTKVIVYMVGEQVLSLSASLFDAFVPSYFGGGVAGGYKFGKMGVNLAFDFLKYRFSEFKFQILEVLEAHPESVGNILSEVTSKKIPDLQDVNVIRGGINLDIGDIVEKIDLILGAGISLFPSPLLSQNDVLTVDSDRTVLTGGIGARFPSPAFIRGKVEFIISGGIQKLSSKKFESPKGNKSSIEGTLPMVSAVLNVLY